MASWDQLGELANVGQLVGFGATQLIGMIVQAAATARMHKKNCRQFAKHLRLIGNLLEQLKLSELKKYPETREPLEQLEDALRRSYILVSSCQERSYLYLLAMGWNIVYQFRKAQSEIDRYLKIIPLITLVENARVRALYFCLIGPFIVRPTSKTKVKQEMQERLEHIDSDDREYTFDDEDKKVQDVILNPDPCSNHKTILKKTLSCSYPNLRFDEALQKENEKLQLELQRSQSSMDIGQCEVIQHLLDVTEAVASSLTEKCAHHNNSKKEQSSNLDGSDYPGYPYDGSCPYDSNAVSRSLSTVSSGHDLISRKGSHKDDKWHSDLLGCCSEPYLCFKTCLYPCGTLSRIASAAKNRPITAADACNDLMAYSLVLSCCCYTCCIRRKLRKVLNITGGLFDDFLSHLMCCCCALVQEYREVEIRGVDAIRPRELFLTFL
ncbi:protein MID1-COMPLEMENTING ACTIVITY 1 isoform X2 [Phalaenopsis equestris]|uniref:protein MID1-COMPLEMENTING ACTIVITY 1 isoform X2 n=1 Tax=Phalaenopsis equestris TaxID=78828 RepID=UPI0009E5A2EB|nr:protein MID1-COMPLEMENTING ACTIVITY 1 isoform X2 [Phalaenopsis equestris]